MAKTYVNAKKYREGLALYERTLTYAKDALEGYKSMRGKTKVSIYRLQSNNCGCAFTVTHGSYTDMSQIVRVTILQPLSSNECIFD